MKKTAVTILKVAASVGLYAIIFSRVDIGHLWSILREASVGYYIIAVLIYLLIQGLSSYRWYLMLRPLAMVISYVKLLSFYFLGMFFNFFLPTAIGGDVFRIYYLNKETRRLSDSTTSVFLDRNIGMGGLVLLATVVATLAGTRLNGVPLAPIFWLILAAFLSANLALFYRPSYNLLHKLLRLLRLQRADERVEKLFRSVNSFRGKWGLIAATVILSVCVQVGCVIVNMFAASAIGLTTNNGWIDFLVFIPAIGLIGMVPLSLNGMGWREFAYIVFFGSVGATEPKAAALAFLWLGVMVLSALPGGILIILRGPSKTRPPSNEELLQENGSDANHVPARAEKVSAIPAQPQEKNRVSTA